jgi:hypothetical protein
MTPSPSPDAKVAPSAPLLASADSMAWSYASRRRVKRCPHGVVKHEANCPIAAATWWHEVTARVGHVAQPALDLFGTAGARADASPSEYAVGAGRDTGAWCA